MRKSIHHLLLATTRLAGFALSQNATGELIPAVQAYWFAWQAFYPETALRN